MREVRLEELRREVERLRPEILRIVLRIRSEVGKRRRRPRSLEEVSRLAQLAKLCSEASIEIVEWRRGSRIVRLRGAAC